MAGIVLQSFGVVKVGRIGVVGKDGEELLPKEYDLMEREDIDDFFIMFSGNTEEEEGSWGGFWSKKHGVVGVGDIGEFGVACRAEIDGTDIFGTGPEGPVESDGDIWGLYGNENTGKEPLTQKQIF